MYAIHLIISKYPVGGPYKVKRIERDDLPYNIGDRVLCDGREGKVAGRELPDNSYEIANIYIDLKSVDDYEKLRGGAGWEEVAQSPNLPVRFLPQL